MNEFVGVIIEEDSELLRNSKYSLDNPKAINEICNALFPELTATAYFVPMYFANSSSNFETLSPPTKDSRFDAE